MLNRQTTQDMKSFKFKNRATTQGETGPGWSLWASILGLALAFVFLPNKTEANSLVNNARNSIFYKICESAAFCPDQEFSKTLTREFQTSADGTVALYNKYGKVNVNTWQNNQVKIEVTFVVNARSQSEADKVFNCLNVNFANSWGYVKAETIICENSGSRGTIFGIPIPGSGQTDYKINYEVWMPAGNQLDLKNRYGDSFVGDLNGKLTAEIKYGDLRTESIRNDCDLTLGYGKATMKAVQNLSGQVSYAELKLTESRDIQLDTKYSELSFEHSANVRLTSKYDDIKLGTALDLRLQTKYADVAAKSVRNIFLTAQYTNVEVQNLAQSLDADMQYGGLHVQSLARGFQSVNLTGKYTDFEVDVERGAAFRFDAEGTYCDLKAPSGANIQRKEEKGSWEALKGSVGGESGGLVKVKLNYGGITFR